MKFRFFPLALCALLCACASAVPPATSAASPETAGTATGESSAPALPDGLRAVDRGVLDYDDIRLVYHYSVWDEPLPGYYTVCRDGQWGLIRNDGSEVLPCTFAQPVALCSDQPPRYPAWIVAANGDNALLADMSRYLDAVGEGVFCGLDHCGPGYEEYFWVESSRQMCACIGTLGPSEPTHISPQRKEKMGYWFPCRPAALVEEDWGLNVRYDADAPYRYRDAEGLPLNNYEYQQAEPFLHGAPLAAARRGSQWVYLDGSGNEVTAPCYDPVYWSFGDPNRGFASPLLNGYAAVCRDGRYGLLDSSGAEFVPCAYNGLVWDGALGWLKQDDGWYAFAIPSAPAALPAPEEETEDPLRDVPLTTVFPDTYPGTGRRTQYTTIRDDNLNVRAGPGTEYDKIGRIPPGSAVQELGTSSTFPGWTFVLYQDWLRGWVSSEYLE